MTDQASLEQRRRQRRDDVAAMFLRFPEAFQRSDLIHAMNITGNEADDLLRQWNDLYISRRRSQLYGEWWVWT